MRRTLSAASLALALPLTSNAQVSTPEFVPPPEVEQKAPTEPPLEFEGDTFGIAGAWTITTDRDDPGCSLNGTAQIRVSPVTGGYTCEIVMRDYCTGRWDGIIRQSCSLSKRGEYIAVDSIVREALYGPLAGYSPDNFYLIPQDDGTLTGNLRSAGSYPVLWRRVFDAIS